MKEVAVGRKKRADLTEDELCLGRMPTEETRCRFKTDDLIRGTGHWIIWVRKGGEEPRWMHVISKVTCRQTEVLLREGLSDEEPVRTAD